ncbi:MAG TPA: RES domain-containing protein [Steroidobacter sp.]|uniref:RES domain-containing protein n=1 Tax=Steroidobacter sp. TaxID=1978227 RepID=UPI002EDAB61B
MRGNVEDKRICAGCVGEKYLKGLVAKTGVRETCAYCGKKGKTLSIGELAEDHIRGAFERHYRRTPLGPPESEEYMYRESDIGWERPGDQAAYAIADAAGLGDDAAEDARSVLEENTFVSPDDYFDSDGEGEFSEESQYEEIDADATELYQDWLYFQKTLKTETRLFNSAAAAVLHSIFDGLDGHATRKGGKVVVNAGPGEKLSALYRSRVFQSDAKLEEALKRPDLGLGPPPAKVATAGRMNARGIAVFYGATHSDVAISETRPPVGSRVLVARFEIIRPLKLLDLVALRSIFVKGSIFDPLHLARLKKAAFLATLGDQATKPVMPDDEPFEYLVTQAIADYLANLDDPKLDGIIYRSVQNGKTKNNVVLFHKASSVKPLDIPPGTEISAHLFEHDEDGVRPDYWVFENVPGPEDEDDLGSDFPVLGLPNLRHRNDSRDPALSIDMASLRVHHIERAQYSSTAFTPTRHRSQRSKGIKRVKPIL